MKADDSILIRSTSRCRIYAVTSLLVIFISIPCGLTQRELQWTKANAALIAAINNHDTPAALAALDAGADPNTTEDARATSFSHILHDSWERLRGRKAQGPAAIILATRSYVIPDTRQAVPGDIRLIRALLERGAECNVGYKVETALINTSPEGQKEAETALINASSEGQKDIVRLLLVYGANVNARDCMGMTALMWATHENSIDTVKTLLDAGADVNIVDNRKGTALMQAVCDNISVSIVKILLKHGADVNSSDYMGMTALMWTARAGNVEDTKVLLAAGADIRLRDNLGYSAKKWAIQRGNGKIAELLKKAGAKQGVL